MLFYNHYQLRLEIDHLEKVILKKKKNYYNMLITN